MRTDIAFAASSIVTRDVPGSEFKYAKIMTIPFFGAGVVELPPGGFKRAKNSRKMQMVFFVHEGKVLVEVGATGLEVNEFALSKGGCWVVPRGKLFPLHQSSFRSTAYHPPPDDTWLRLEFFFPPKSWPTSNQPPANLHHCPRLFSHQGGEHITRQTRIIAVSELQPALRSGSWWR